MQIIKPDIDYYIDRLNSPFAFVRYGDGELFCMRGESGKNCDGHLYSPELGKDLVTSLLPYEENYIRAIGHKALETQPDLDDYLLSLGVDYEWHNTDVFLDVSIKGELNQFVKALREKRILYAGPKHLRKFIQTNFNVEYLTIPATNAYLQIDSILESIVNKIDDFDMFCISGGPPAKVIIYKLWFDYNKKDKIYLDLGSMWDGYVGKHSRSHTRKLSKQNIKRNMKK